MSATSFTPCTYFNIKFENNTAGIYHPEDTINGRIMKFTSFDENNLKLF